MKVAPEAPTISAVNLQLPAATKRSDPTTKPGQLWKNIFQPHTYPSTRRIVSMRRGDAVILANAIIWTAVILGMTFIMAGTDYLSQLIVVVGGGAAASVVVVGGGVRRIQSST